MSEGLNNNLKKNVLIRKAKPEDAENFVKFVIETDPEFFPMFFGKNYHGLLKKIFVIKENLFSYQNVKVIESDNKVAGMVLRYDWAIKKEQALKTGLLLLKFSGFDLFKRLFIYLNLDNLSGKIRENECYISNLAIFSEFRNKGLGTLLLKDVENWAKERGNKKLVLEAYIDNVGAIRLYQRFGFEIFKEYSVKIDGKVFRYLKMRKYI